MMSVLLVVVHVIVCFILILVILLQAGRGQGLTGPSFASGNVQSLFGTRAADFLTKATSVAAICFLFTCIGLDIIESRKSRSLLEGMKQPSPVDMETIKKALEKVKSEADAKQPAAAGAVNAAADASAAAAATAASSAAPATAKVEASAAPAAAAVPVPEPKATGEPQKS